MLHSPLIKWDLSSIKLKPHNFYVGAYLVHLAQECVPEENWVSVSLPWKWLRHSQYGLQTFVHCCFASLSTPFPSLSGTKAVLNSSHWGLQPDFSQWNAFCGVGSQGKEQQQMDQPWMFLLNALTCTQAHQFGCHQTHQLWMQKPQHLGYSTSL